MIVGGKIANRQNLMDKDGPVPGEYRGPASRAYLYYTSDEKHWVEPIAIKIRPMMANEGPVAQK